MIALTYEETTNYVEDFVAGENQFTNVYFILTGIFGDEEFMARTARLTINIWIFNSADLTKTCYQWRLTDADLSCLIDDVAGEIITEERENTVTGIRPLPTLNHDMSEYSQLYRNCLDHFLKSLNLHSLDQLFKSRPDNLYKEKRLVL